VFPCMAVSLCVCECRCGCCSESCCVCVSVLPVSVRVWCATWSSQRQAASVPGCGVRREVRHDGGPAGLVDQVSCSSGGSNRGSACGVETRYGCMLASCRALSCADVVHVHMVMGNAGVCVCACACLPGCRGVRHQALTRLRRPQVAIPGRGDRRVAAPCLSLTDTFSRSGPANAIEYFEYVPV
jgi:hypothetical protein